MTIQEAIKSGKPFKLAPEIGWLEIDSHGLIFHVGSTILKHFHAEELLSEEWEIRGQEDFIDEQEALYRRLPQRIE